MKDGVPYSSQESGILKMKCIICSIIALLGGLSHDVFAADGTINFTGEIVTVPCKVDPGSQNLTVPLGRVPLDKLDGSAGKLSDDQRFSINLKGCGRSIKHVNVQLDGATDPDNGNVYGLNSSAGHAIGVGLEVSIAGDTNPAPIWRGTSHAIGIQPGDNTLNMSAHYISTRDQVTAGTANATVTFTLSYD